VAPDGEARVSVFPTGDSTTNQGLINFVELVRRMEPQATGAAISIQESGRTISRAFVTAGILALVAITALMALVLRRLRDVLLVLVPLTLAGVLTLGTTVLIGLPINFANIIALPLLLGIGVSFALYFVQNWRAGQPHPLQSGTARAVLFSALTTMSAFGALALSHHPGTADMGKLLAISLSYTLLATLFVLPAAMGEPPEAGIG
jgi:predicted RND superfamily exporter protein